jgi:hypothetical protein
VGVTALGGGRQSVVTYGILVCERAYLCSPGVCFPALVGPKAATSARESLAEDSIAR